MKKFHEVVQSLPEKDEHKKSKEYKKLSPKMREAVDNIFSVMDAKPSDFLNTFKKTIKDSAKKFKVKEKDLLKYFEREMLGTVEPYVGNFFSKAWVRKHILHQTQDEIDEIEKEMETEGGGEESDDMMMSHKPTKGKML